MFIFPSKDANQEFGFTNRTAIAVVWLVQTWHSHYDTYVSITNYSVAKRDARLEPHLHVMMYLLK